MDSNTMRIQIKDAFSKLIQFEEFDTLATCNEEQITIKTNGNEATDLKVPVSQTPIIAVKIEAQINNKNNIFLTEVLKK